MVAIGIRASRARACLPNFERLHCFLKAENRASGRKKLREGTGDMGSYNWPAILARDYSYATGQWPCTSRCLSAPFFLVPRFDPEETVSPRSETSKSSGRACEFSTTRGADA